MRWSNKYKELWKKEMRETVLKMITPKTLNMNHHI